MSRDRLLLTGASGFLGHALVREIESRGMECVRAGRDPGADLRVDLGEPASLARAWRAASARLVLHAAARASLAACQAEPALALRTNVAATRALAEQAGSALVFVSSDLVFDGSRAPYRAGDPSSPLSVYARSKVRAEQEVLSRDGRVMRLPLLFGRSFDGQRGATDMLRSATSRLVLYENEVRSPLHVADAARGLIELALEETRPVTHLAGRDRVSRVELAERFVANGGQVPAGFESGSCDDPLRPRDVSLLADWSPARDLDEALRES